MSVRRIAFQLLEAGRGWLIKCYLNEIQDDRVGIVNLPLGSRPTCPGCGKEIGILRIVRGRPALKLNHGTVQKIRI